MFGQILASCLALFFLNPSTPSQQDKTQQSPVPAPSLDAEFRKFEKLASFVRARNARDYAISTANGIDEGSYVTIGGIE